MTANGQRFMGEHYIPCLACGRTHVMYTTGRLFTGSALRRTATRCARRHGRRIDLGDNILACLDQLRGQKPVPVQRPTSRHSSYLTESRKLLN